MLGSFNAPRAATCPSLFDNSSSNFSKNSEKLSAPVFEAALKNDVMYFSLYASAASAIFSFLPPRRARIKPYSLTGSGRFCHPSNTSPIIPTIKPPTALMSSKAVLATCNMSFKSFLKSDRFSGLLSSFIYPIKSRVTDMSSSPMAFCISVIRPMIFSRSLPTPTCPSVDTMRSSNSR